jgi:hypothetical protein
MGSSAIADIGETLISLLRDGLRGMIPEDSIILFSPGEIEANEAPRLCLFLYQVVENAHLRNQEMHRTDDDKSRYPGITLDLQYMLIPYSSSKIPDRTERTEEDHKILGKAMQILHDNAILRDPRLKGGLAAKGLEIRVTINPISLDEMTKLWQAFQTKPFKAAVCYVVTPIVLDSEREVYTKRVVSAERETYAKTD